MKRTLLLVYSIAALLSSFQPAGAEWPPNGVPLCTTPGSEWSPAIVTDGAGGAIVTWYDYQGGDVYDIYARRIDVTGNALWTINGVALCTAPGVQWYPTIASDGAGGAIVTWQDYRNHSNWDIYARRVDAAGNVLWTTDGAPVCTSAGDQGYPQVISDDAGGAIITWQDARIPNPGVYAQRIDASGNTVWTPGGVALCTVAIGAPQLATDGASGAIVTWNDSRAGSFDIYARRIDASGNPLWSADGVPLCLERGDQQYPRIVSDGAGGAIVTWQDFRALWDIYAARINASGNPVWTENGVALCVANGEQLNPVIASDGKHGAIVAWQDHRFGGGAGWEIYARRVDSTGDPVWEPNGVVVCNAGNTQDYPAIVPDGVGGAIVTWKDERNLGDLDVYARRIDASGNALWDINGVALCTAAGAQWNPSIISVGVYGAIVTWEDYREGLSDIVAQRVTVGGAIPTAVAPRLGGPRLIVGDVSPNPFSGTASMEVDVAWPSSVEIDVYDVAGRAIYSVTLSDVVGTRRVDFDGRDQTGRLLPSGVYFFRVKTAGESITRKMVIAR